MHTNPLMTFYNEGPYLSVPASISISVAGEDSVLVLGKSVPLSLVYGDKHDDDTTLITVFKSLSPEYVKDTTASFVLNKTSKVVNINFDKTWMDEFVQRDAYTNGVVTSQEIKFQMSITDSQQKSTTKIIAFNVTHDSKWDSDGNSDKINDGIRTQILTRAGGDAGTQPEMCYSAKRDGWSTSRFHALCDDKGPLLNILKRSGSDRIFGGYTPVSVSSTCRYQYVNTIGDVKPGEDGSDRAWMFHVKDATPDTLEIAYTKSSVAMYSCSRYFMTWGTGHDFTCQANGCYCNIGYAYRTAADNRPALEWCTGTYRFNANADVFDFYEVYVVNAK